jgi:hypothetical protein
MSLTLYPLTVGVWCRGRDVRGVGTPAHRSPPCTLTYGQRSDPRSTPKGATSTLPIRWTEQRPSKPNLGGSGLSRTDTRCHNIAGLGHCLPPHVRRCGSRSLHNDCTTGAALGPYFRAGFFGGLTASVGMERTGLGRPRTPLLLVWIYWWGEMRH